MSINAPSAPQQEQPNAVPQTIPNKPQHINRSMCLIYREPDPSRLQPGLSSAFASSSHDVKGGSKGLHATHTRNS